MNDLIGKSFGRYHILEQLGEGGMATVYKAYDTRLETDVAVKVIRTENILPSLLNRSLRRFEREAKALARLTHPNIVKVTDYGEYEGKPYLVMPYLLGGTLKQKMGKPIPWQESIQLLLPIAEALDYAHSQNMIHRDVKPSNILLTPRGQPMLADFGIAKILDLDDALDLTGTSTAIGTPEYMAPEQATAKIVDHRADIYALGIVLYEMMTGRKPFTADTPMAVLIKQSTEPLPRPRRFVSNLPDGVEKILFKALAKQPENRYQSMDDFAVALKGMLDGKAIKKQRTVPLPPAPDNDKTIEEDMRSDGYTRTVSVPRRRNLIPVIITGLIGLVCLMVVAIMSWQVYTQPVAGTVPLVFTGDSSGIVNAFVYDGQKTTRLLQPATGVKNWSPALSANGNLYFTSDRDGKAEIYLLAKEKVERLTYTDGNFESWGPAPSDSGNLYFTSNRDGKVEIYVYADGKTKRLTYTEGGESWGPAPSSSGNLYFTSDRDGKAEIYVFADGKTKRFTYTAGSFQSWGASPSSSGNVYFTSNRDGKAEIYVFANGKTKRLTYTAGSFQSWAPVIRGQNIYFTSNRSNQSQVYSFNGSTIAISDMRSWTNLLMDKLPAY